MQLGGSRFFDCYIPALGCDVRIHTGSLLRGGDAAVAADWGADDKCAGRGVAAPGGRVGVRLGEVGGGGGPGGGGRQANEIGRARQTTKPGMPPCNTTHHSLPTHPSWVGSE